MDCADGQIPEPVLEELHPSLVVVHGLVPLGEPGDKVLKRRPHPGGRTPRSRVRPEYALAETYGAYSAPNEPWMTSRTSPTPK